jgi:hypothetical protein
LSRKTTQPTKSLALLGHALLSVAEACRDIRIISRAG